MKKTINKLFLLIAVLFLALTSCKKKPKVEDPQPVAEDPAVATGTYMMHLHIFIEDNEVYGYNIVYTNGSGRKISLSMSQLYISGIQLVKADGSTYDVTNKKILKTFETETYVIGTAPVGNYKSVRFKVGLDPTTNQMSPTTPSDSALLNKPAMWMSISAQPDGYVFFNLQGKIDTTYDASATIAQMQPFVYKIGTNANLKQISMPDKAYSIVKDQATYSHIYIDVMKLFSGIQLNQPANLSVTTVSANSMSTATTIVNNIPLMFRYE